ncbi:hypothetical protein NA2_05256 [Nitratireductor pacificus pht-3B]|uniref:TRAP transporter small permease protein n=2 Tax=Nitratireductor TaxID=245876 RepID=K2MDD1_9HYPH|nr:hypothetical protein NA2_05256 [Nitratireductor pacificus pht-3B]
MENRIENETVPEAGTVTALGRLMKLALGVAGGIALCAMMVLSVYDALGRSLFNAPLFGANDITQVLLVTTVAAALPLCILAGQAIRIDILADMLPPALGRMVDAVLRWVGAVMLGYLAWRCLLNGLEATRFGETTMLLLISHAPFYLLLAGGLALGALILLFPQLVKRQSR